jgi:hypothetical protein
VIQNKVLKEFRGGINVVTLGDLIYESK